MNKIEYEKTMIRRGLVVRKPCLQESCLGWLFSGLFLTQYFEADFVYLIQYFEADFLYLIQ